MSGSLLHWITTANDSTTLRFHLQSDCVAPCTAIPSPGGSFLKHMVAGTAPEAFGVQENGPLFRFGGAGSSYETVSTVEAPSPDLARGPAHVFESDLDAAKIRRFRHDGANTGEITLPPIAVTDTKQGARLIAADATEVFALRTDDGLWRASANAPSTAVRWINFPAPDAYKMTVDDKHVYIARANSGGVFAYARDNGTEREVYRGNVFRVAADAQGVYWGEHRHATAASVPGAIFMMVK